MENNYKVTKKNGAYPICVIPKNSIKISFYSVSNSNVSFKLTLEWTGGGKKLAKKKKIVKNDITSISTLYIANIRRTLKFTTDIER